MRIAVDVRALQAGSEYRGIGAYILQVLGRLPIVDGEHDFVFLRFDHTDPLAPLELPPGSYDEVLVPMAGSTGKISVLRRAWREAFHDDYGDLFAQDVDVFWQPDALQGIPARAGMRTVVTMYDLIPLIFPDEYQPARRTRVRRMASAGPLNLARHLLAAEVFDRRYRRSLDAVGTADAVLSISASTTEDLVAELGCPRARIVTVPLGGPAPMGESEDHPVDRQDLAEVGVGDRPFLLYVGGLDHRRRLVDLIKAYDQLRASGRVLDLVLAGRDFEYLEAHGDQSGPQALAASPYRDDIHVCGFISESVKNALFRHAIAFVYPSLYEGFGLPVLEAMAHRCPVVAYRNSSLPEVAGDAAVLVDGRADALASAIADLLDDPGRRAALVEAGLRQVATFSWDRCANETMRVLTGDHAR